MWLTPVIFLLWYYSRKVIRLINCLETVFAENNASMIQIFLRVGLGDTSVQELCALFKDNSQTLSEGQSATPAVTVATLTVIKKRASESVA